jgi:uroporphyrinogen decarboxylase
MAGEKIVVLSNARPALWDHAPYLMGLKRALVNLATNQPLMEALADRILEWQVAFWDMALSQVGDYVDVVNLSDDLGGQEGPLMAPATFRRIYKPRLRRLIEAIKRKSPVRVYLHSCGSVYTVHSRLHRDWGGHFESGAGERG